MRLDEEITELRKEINKFRTETSQRLEVIENEVNKQVSLNYNRTIIDYVTEMSKDLVENLKCDRPEEETFCKTQMNNLQTDYLAFLKAGKFNDSYNALETTIETINMLIQNFDENGRRGCVSCMENEKRAMTSNMQLIDQLRIIDSPAVTLSQNTATVKSLDTEKTSTLILNPISNKTRLQILQSIYKGENRFNDLSKATGLSGGQLLYHIKKLRDANYVDQYESKDYVLSTKGMKTLIMLAQLSQELN